MILGVQWVNICLLSQHVRFQSDPLPSKQVGISTIHIRKQSEIGVMPPQRQA